MKFSLYYWLSDNILEGNSKVNLGIHQALKDAGIKIRIPQRIEFSATSADDGAKEVVKENPKEESGMQHHSEKENE